MTTPTEREAFEAWASHPDRHGKLPIEAHANGAYKDSRTYSAYYGWTARADMLAADAKEIARSQAECDIIAEINHGQWLALENIRLLASRHRKEEWAQHILRFCESAGSSATTLRVAADAQQVIQLKATIEKQRLDLIDAGNEINAFIDTTRRLNEQVGALKPDARRYRYARLGMRYSLSKDRTLTEDEVDKYFDTRLGVNHE